jgi:hypothetical protein
MRCKEEEREPPPDYANIHVHDVWFNQRVIFRISTLGLNRTLNADSQFIKPSMATTLPFIIER